MDTDPIAEAVDDDLERKTGLNREQRRLRAQIAAAGRWSKPGARRKQSLAVADAKLRRHEQLVDPDGVLDPVERRKCAEASLRAEMARLAFASAKTRNREAS